MDLHQEGVRGVADPGAVLDDLRAEGAELGRLVAGLDAGRWAAATPAPGRTIAHQIAHPAWTDAMALLAATVPGAFARNAERAAAAPGTFVDEGARQGAGRPPAELLARWRPGRATLLDALRAVPRGARLPWYGPPMSAASMATGRLTETWAHGQDVADALGLVREPETARLRHVARIGVRARDYAFSTRGLTPPAGEFRVGLTAPGGERWAYGPEDATQRGTGPALDFCLLVTQRRHRDDLAVRASGAEAGRWLDIAQSFAAPQPVGLRLDSTAGGCRSLVPRSQPPPSAPSRLRPPHAGRGRGPGQFA